MGEEVKLAVVDYGTGNLTSLIRALEHLGASPTRLKEPTDQSQFQAALLPGVGAFPNAMSSLKALGWDQWISELVATERPLLGICLGMQLLFDSSEEIEKCDGLKLIPGEVSKLDSRGDRIPHIGWSEVRWTQPSPLSEGLEEGAAMYHVHSFVCRPMNQVSELATAEHGEVFTTAAWNGKNVFGVQFHPEKSSEDGLRLLNNFISLAKDS